MGVSAKKRPEPLNIKGSSLLKLEATTRFEPVIALKYRIEWRKTHADCVCASRRASRMDASAFCSSSCFLQFW